MLTVDKVQTYGWEAAVRGMRNPMNSQEKSDSLPDGNPKYYNVGPNDLALMQKLIKAGPDHAKFLRMIGLSMDIAAPLYWWKEYDTYKVGTVANSCSTMHKIAEKKFTRDDFSHEHLVPRMMEVLDVTIANLNACRGIYLETQDKKMVVADDPAPPQQLQPITHGDAQLRRRAQHLPRAQEPQAGRVAHALQDAGGAALLEAHHDLIDPRRYVHGFDTEEQDDGALRIERGAGGAGIEQRQRAARAHARGRGQWAA